MPPLKPQNAPEHGNVRDHRRRVVAGNARKPHEGSVVCAQCRIRKKITVFGVVQGVGFRPFVYRLARESSLAGYVENNPAGVTIEVEGSAERVALFLQRLRTASAAPRLAVIREIREELVEPQGDQTFVIAASRGEGERVVWISPDTCVCDDCLRELFDPADRRYRYPFINCTNCGPRFTIITDIPYDRPNTTMRKFEMCPDCRREYDDPSDRRFHAQPNACPRCGPQVSLVDADGHVMHTGWEAIHSAARHLRERWIVAVKGLGGFHLAVDAQSEPAVARLRERKHREEKPLAVMVRDLDKAREAAVLNEAAERLLLSIARPIVLLAKRVPSPLALGYTSTVPAGTVDMTCNRALAHAVAPTSRYHGLMLPYTPLHFLLLHPDASGPEALVMTSGNVTDEPIVTENEEAMVRLKGIADFFLLHDRDIHIRADDSVTTVVRNRPVVLRRSRGYVPTPIEVDFPKGAEGKEVVAVGAELKSVICVTRGNTAILSQHVGDIKNLETFASFEKSVEHLQRIMQVKPVAIAHDMHPLYMSTDYALRRSKAEGIPSFAIQHHHAHFAACVADRGHALQGRGIGVSYDGTGYGTDGRIWGGEILDASLTDFRRAAHLEYVAMPGADAAVEESWRMALSYLFHAYRDPSQVVEHLLSMQKALGKPLVADVERKAEQVQRMIEMRINSPQTSSMGRLFDAVSAMCGVCTEATYEGQPAIELEGTVEDGVEDAYVFSVDRAVEPWQIRTGAAIRSIVADIVRGAPVGRIAAMFHNAVAAATAEVCKGLRESKGLKVVTLSGGVFQNLYLLQRLEPRLEDEGFQVLSHSRVPPNDGAVALGQAVIAKRLLAHCGGRACPGGLAAGGTASR